MNIFEVLLLLLGLLVLGWLVYKWSVSQRLSETVFQKYSVQILNTKKLNPAHAVLESHKLFVAALGTLFNGKKMTAAQTIARVQKRFPNQRQIWRHHKLRNRIAHETEVTVLPTQAELARKDFVRALRSLR
ncbi:hypothetical protein CSB37_04310 [bacterium DOLZORAL124_38_8]|nr:MAG: hypothetical protein CSB37_04310 [bacterium DOLZORAL124_38_8]